MGASSSCGGIHSRLAHLIRVDGYAIPLWTWQGQAHLGLLEILALPNKHRFAASTDDNDANDTESFEYREVHPGSNLRAASSPSLSPYADAPSGARRNPRELRLLPGELEVIVDTLSELGYVVEGSRIPYAYGVAALITVAWSQSDNLYLMHVPRYVLDRSDSKALGELQNLRLLASRAPRAFLFSRKVNSTSSLFDTQTDAWEDEGIHVRFVRWKDVVQLRRHTDRLYDIEVLLRLPGSTLRATVESVGDREVVSGRAALHAAVPREPLREELTYVAEMIANVLSVFGHHTTTAMGNLVSELQLPIEWEQQIRATLTGDLLADSRTLVNIARSKSYYPADHHYRGSQVLGRLINWLYMQRGEPGMRQRLLRMLRAYALLPSEDITRLAQS
jgi:hypothetical protein